MTTYFHYAARDTRGVKIAGGVIARNIEAALVALQETGICVTSIEPALTDWLGVGRSGRVVLSAQEKSLLMESWSRLLNAGFSMDAVLSNLQNSTSNPSVRRALHDTQRLIRDGMTLGEAVEASGLLPPSWAAVLAAGEKRGDFVGPLEVMHKRCDQIRKTVQEVISALLMPSVLLALVFVWMWVFATWLLPVMAATIVDLTGTANLVMVGLKGLTAMTFPAAVCAVLILCLLVLSVLRGNRADEVMGTLPTWVPVHFPFIGSLVSKVHLIVVTSELQLQLEAGIPILAAITTLSRSLPKRSLRKQLAGAYREICGGAPVWQVLGNLRIMPDRALALLAAGQACGKLPELMGVLVREASLDLETEAHRLEIKMRTSAILLAGVIVGVLAVSLMAVISCAFDSVAQMAVSQVSPR